ncbi:MAG: hypothetical protein ACLP4R_07150 [Solirubrobacteraceae bacterium]
MAFTSFTVAPAGTSATPVIAEPETPTSSDTFPYSAPTLAAASTDTE